VGVCPVSMRKCLRVEVGRALVRKSSLVTSTEREVPAGEIWYVVVKVAVDGSSS
jgi:hypothetical protein